MRQTDGVIPEAIYYDVVCTLSTSTYEADAVIMPLPHCWMMTAPTRLLANDSPPLHENCAAETSFHLSFCLEQKNNCWCNQCINVIILSMGAGDPGSPPPIYGPKCPRLHTGFSKNWQNHMFVSVVVGGRGSRPLDLTKTLLRVVRYGIRNV